MAARGVSRVLGNGESGVEESELDESIIEKTEAEEVVGVDPVEMDDEELRMGTTSR